MKTYAVLTGDLIGSRELGTQKLQSAMALVRRLADEFAAVHANAMVSHPDVFRGDSWQLCLQSAHLAVTAAVFIRAGLKAGELDSRIGIGVGGVAALHEAKISESTGPAFVASGDALDGLAKDHTLGFKHAAEPAPTWAEAVRELVMPLLDVQVTGWSQRESFAVHGTLRQLTQQEIADLPAGRTREGTPPTRQAIQDALRRIVWTTHVGPVLTNLEKLLSQLLA
jgi:hypothetical protein